MGDSEINSVPPPTPVVLAYSRHRRLVVGLSAAFLFFLSVSSLYWWRRPSAVLTVDGETRRI